MQLFDLLDETERYLKGRRASPEEILKLSKSFERFSNFSTLKNIIASYKIIGHEFPLNEADDLSGIGMDMEWMTPDQQIDEAFNAYPGIVVSKHDYIPIGNCLFGSGDQYFLKSDKNYTFQIFRILHDLVLDGVYRPEMAEHVISLNDLIRRIGK